MTRALPTPAEPTRFLGDIHRLRGVAILLIVATHCLYFFHWTEHHALENALYDLLDDSTVLFVFISGYLFLHGRETFSYRRYLLTKFRNVVLPYAIASIPAILLELRHAGSALDTYGLNELSLPAKLLYLCLYPGSHINYALWFIPVVVIYYIASPLLLWIAQRPWRYGVLGVLLPLSVLMHRPSYAHDHNFALALYFLSAYVLGMWCRQYRSATLAWMDRGFVLFLFAFLAVFIAHLMFSDHHGKYTFTSLADLHRDGTIDWIFVQKILLIPVLCHLAWRWRHLRLAALDYIGDVSFSIYFLHLYVIYAAGWWVHWQMPEVSFAGYAALFAVAVLVPCTIASASRWLVPAWSRSLVGS